MFVRSCGFKSHRSHQQKETHVCVSLFVGAALLLCKSGRLRAGDRTRKGNPTKVSLAHIPFLAVCGVLPASEVIGRSTPRVFDMLGGNEFRLRQGFACGKTLVTRHPARPSISRNPTKACGNSVCPQSKRDIRQDVSLLLMRCCTAVHHSVSDRRRAT